MSDDLIIPLCRSEWLQDASIELGRRFAAHHPFRSFSTQLDTREHEGEHQERLTVWASTWYGTLVNLTLWDDHTVWIGVTLQAAENNPEYEVGFYPQCSGFSSERVAEAFRDTVSLSTRLCYGESPLFTLRRIWNHTGEVQTKGMLKTPQKNQPCAPPNDGPAERQNNSAVGGGLPSVS
ncbi:MAG TPA: hypothetical protein VEC99_09445 [Clostridia bacterium]|nr:hypothetical protein [Clostridia bacterium]